MHSRLLQQGAAIVRAVVLLVALVLCAGTPAFAQQGKAKPKQPKSGGDVSYICNVETDPTCGESAVPPVLWFDPANGTTVYGNPRFALGACPTQMNFAVSTQAAWLNGVDITTTLGIAAYSLNGCTYRTLWAYGIGDQPYGSAVSQWPSNVPAFQVGRNVLRMTACTGTGTGKACATDSVVVTKSNVQVRAQQATGFAVAGTGASQTFIVTNKGSVSAKFTLSATCSGAALSPCVTADSVRLNAGDSANVAVTYQGGTAGASGTVSLKATYGANVVSASASTTITIGWPAKLSVNTDFTANGGQFAAVCAQGCFTGVASAASVPYYSGGTPRNVALEYSVDRAMPRPFIMADVSVGSGAAVVSEIELQVIDTAAGNKKIQFLNGDNVLRFAAGAIATKTVRLAGQFDAVANGYTTTQLRALQVVVKLYYSDNVNHTETSTKRILLPILASNIHGVAKGWAIQGLPRVFEQADGTAMVVEGNSLVTYFARNAGSYVPLAEEFSALTVSSPSPATNGDTTRTWTRSFPDSTKQVFNYLGYLRSINNAAGATTTLQYDTQGRLRTVNDPVRTNAAINLTYDANGLSSIYEVLPQSATPSGWITLAGKTSSWIPGRTTLITVSPTGNLTNFRDPDAAQTQFGYDSKGRIQTSTDRRGQTSTYVYAADSSNRLVKVIAPAITVRNAANTSDTTGSPTMLLQAWQTVGLPTTPTGAPGALHPVPPSVDTILARVTDAGGHRTSFTVDRFGQPLVITAPFGAQTTIVRANGVRPLSITDPTGATEHWSYSGPFVISHSTTGTKGATYGYGAYGVLTSVSVDGQEVSTNYVGVGGSVDSARANGLLMKFEYDGLGRRTKSTDPDGHATRYFYDDISGNLDSVVTAEGRGTYVVFDPYGRPWTTQALGFTAVDTTLYDDLNRVVSYRDGRNATATQYVYDAGLLLKVIDPRGQTYKTDYNAIGWAVRQYAAYASPDSATAKFSDVAYDIDGQPVMTTNRRRQQVKVQYDSLHRATARTGTAVDDHFGYSANGLIAASWNAMVTDSTFLNVVGAPDSLVTKLNGQRYSRRYSYDLDGRLIKTTYSGPSGAVPGDRNWWYSFYGTLDSLGVDSNHVALHYANGGLRTIGWPGGAQQTFDLSADHQLTKSAFNVTGIDTALTRSYGYDWRGSIALVTRPKGQPGQEWAFEYDKMNQLSYARRGHYSLQQQCYTDPSDPSGLPTCEMVQVFTNDADGTLAYDPASNLTQQAGSGAWPSIVGTYAIGNSQSPWGVANYTYDDDGNRLTKTVNGVATTYTWSPTGLLTAVSQGGQVINYDYNANGQLVARRVSTDNTKNRYYLWERGQLLSELNNTASTRINEYAYASGGDHPIMMISGAPLSSRTYSLEVDASGNVIGMFNRTKAVQSITYDPWGKGETLVSVAADTSHLRWKGLLYDDGMPQLYYMRARWYDPDARRFVSEDPLGLAGGVNQYSFAGGDPVNGSDPTGMIVPDGYECTQSAMVHIVSTEDKEVWEQMCFVMMPTIMVWGQAGVDYLDRMQGETDAYIRRLMAANPQSLSYEQLAARNFNMRQNLADTQTREWGRCLGRSFADVGSAAAASALGAARGASGFAAVIGGLRGIVASRNGATPFGVLFVSAGWGSAAALTVPVARQLFRSAAASEVAGEAVGTGAAGGVAAGGFAIGYGATASVTCASNPDAY